ncbi:MAG: hypothetical protein ABI743_11000, partial [bacterium]
RWGPGEAWATSLVLLAIAATDPEPDIEWVQRGRAWLAKQETAALSPMEQALILASLVATNPTNDVGYDDGLLPRVRQCCAAFTAEGPVAGAAYPLFYRVDWFQAPLFDLALAIPALGLAGRALLKGVTEARREVIWGRVRPARVAGPDLDGPELAKHYAALRNLTLKLAGSGDDIGQRIVVHFATYRDSGRNFVFPLLALHGAGWAHWYFGIMDKLLPWYATFRHPINWKRRDSLKKRMRVAMAGFKEANRRVLADTVANYHFARLYGTAPKAATVLNEPVLGILVAMHAACAEQEPLTKRRKREIYEQAFRWEQSNSVWPMVERTIRGLNDPLVQAIAFRPIVQFKYFRWWEFLIFSDFTKTEERIAQGWRAYEIAEQVGWAATEWSISQYPFLPLDTREYYLELLARFGASPTDLAEHALAPPVLSRALTADRRRPAPPVRGRHM